MTDNKYFRSPLFYVGDKFKLLPQIVPLFPEIKGRFIEVFAGGGSVFLNAPVEEVFVNDLDTNLISIHQELLSFKSSEAQLLKDIQKLIEKYGFTDTSSGFVINKEIKKEFPKTYFAKINRDAYNKMKENFNSAQDKNYLELYLLLIYGFNRMLRFNKNGFFNIPVGNVDFNKNVKRALIEYLKIINLKKINLYNDDYRKFLQRIKPKVNDFIYLDPPYLITGSEYNKLWNESEESELYEIVDKLHEKGVKFMLSNVVNYGIRHNPILEKWAEKYTIVEIKSNYINRFDNKQKKLREILVVNYV
jgi:DNA adenine methylase